MSIKLLDVETWVDPALATRRLLRSSNGAREWAETVRAQLEDVGGALPELAGQTRRQAAERRW